MRQTVSEMANQSIKRSKSTDTNLPFTEQFQFLVIYSLLVAVRLHFAFGTSYIHPDEHFQGPEVVVDGLFGWSASLPWEFSNNNPVNSPIRSILPIWLVYGFPMWFIKLLYGTDPDPALLFYALRFTFFSLSFLNDWAVYRLAGDAYRHIAALLYASSYVTWTFQTHTFSNSVEALLVSCSILTILAFKRTRTKVSFAASALGIFASLGVFFRITFPAFLLPAAISCIPDILRQPQRLILPVLSCFLATLVLVCADTYYFSPDLSLSRPVVTPWSNFKYNINIRNLVEHGLHPPWTHLFVNLPCLLGPSLFIPLLAPQPIRITIKQLAADTSFLCSVSGLILLSLRPHQEFRFLLPIIPLLLVSLSRFLPPNLFVPTNTKVNLYSRSRAKPKYGDALRLRRISSRRGKGYFGWCAVWIIFNVVAGIFMGSLHQSGIVPCTRYLSDRIRRTPFIPVCLYPEKSDLIRQTRMIWHRTYPAPDWLFGQRLVDNQTSIEIFNLGGKWKRLWELLQESAKVDIRSAKMEQSNANQCDAWYVARNNTLQRTFIIAPLSAVPLDKSIIDPLDYETPREWGLFPIRKFDFHINLDDVDLNNEGLGETVARVLGRHGLGVWLLVSI